MRKERIFLYDNYRAVLMCLVVIGHSADSLTSSSDVCKSIFVFIYAFHMPAFLFLSGMFFQETDIAGKVLAILVLGSR